VQGAWDGTVTFAYPWAATFIPNWLRSSMIIDQKMTLLYARQSQSPGTLMETPATDLGTQPRFT
jgi:hypothetical protein